MEIWGWGVGTLWLSSSQHHLLPKFPRTLRIFRHTLAQSLQNMAVEVSVLVLAMGLDFESQDMLTTLS